MNNRIDNKELRWIVFNKYDGHCAYCGVELSDRFTIDHLIPKRRWNTDLPHGDSKLYNYMPCCQSCNSGKNSFELEDWRIFIKNRFNVLLRDSSQFRSLLRFGIINRTENDVIFYFEKHGGIK